MTRSIAYLVVSQFVIIGGFAYADKRVDLVVGESQFFNADNITIKSVKSSGNGFEVGATVTVKGVYVLNSVDTAHLGFYTTTSLKQGEKPSPTPVQESQWTTAINGKHKFTLSKTIKRKGNPHLTFYHPETRKPFGGVYFGDKSNVLMKKSWSYNPPQQANAAAQSTAKPGALAGERKVSRIVSPDGTQVAYGHFTVGPKGEVSSHVIVCAVDGTNRRIVPLDLERDHEVLWYGDDTLACSNPDERAYHLVDLEGTQQGEIRLPMECEVLYKTLSPNGRYVAFSGRLAAGDASSEKKHGVFVYDITGGELCHLWSEPIKTTPSWSPDSMRLAVGNAGGYVKSYPLSIAKIEDSSTEDVPTLGVGISWAPTNDVLAFTTKVVKGGSWSQGVPMDGRIGVWDLDKASLALVSQKGVNRHGKEKPWEVSGCHRPVWSPDGKLIAYQRRHRKGDDVKEEVWVVQRDGTGRQKILNHAADVVFLPDSESLVWVEDGRMGNVELNEELPELGETPWRPYHQFSVYGTVRDDSGEPIANATVRVATGYGTLRCWKPVLTNDKGEYRAFFGPGMQMFKNPVQLQVANVAVEKDGYFEDSLGQKGNLAMAYRHPQKTNNKWYNRIVYERHPYRLDFVLRQAAQVRARLINSQGEPLADYDIALDDASKRKDNSLVSLRTDAEGYFAYDLIPLRDYRFRLGSAKGPKIESQPFSFSEARKYELELNYDELSATLLW